MLEEDMKKTVLAIALCICMFVCLACSAQGEPSGSKLSPSSTSTLDQAIHFADANFQQAIRAQIDKPVGDIFPADVQTIKTLHFGQMKIESISGIEHFTALQELDLTGNNISDVHNLASLTNLTSLSLAENNISDISSLKELVHLESLEVRDNYYLSDMSVVSNFPELQYIGFAFTNVSDISALRNLHKLSALPSADNTPVWDYTPLTPILEDIIENRKKDNKEAGEQWLSDMEKDIRDIHEKNLQAGQFIKQTMAEIILPTMTALEKEVAVFYFVVNHMAYEFGGYDGYSNSELYNIFMNKKGICHQYATAFSVLCNAAGVDCFFVRGVAGGEDHVWNIVGIDDAYFQVDTTWADAGTINYDYFNRSTEAMYALGQRISNRPDVDKECLYDATEAEVRTLVPGYIRGQ